MSDGARLLGGSLNLSAYPFSVSADRAGQPYLVRLGQHAVLPLPRYNYVVTRSRHYLCIIHLGLGIGINPYRLGLALGPSSGIFKYEPPAQDSLAQAVPSGRTRQYVRFAPSVSIIKAIASSRSILACTGIPASKLARRYPAVAKKSAI